MIRLIISALFLVFSLSLFADERVYQRKSISSPTFVWIADKHLDSRQFLPDQTLLGKNLEQQLLLQRFALACWLRRQHRPKVQHH